MKELFLATSFSNKLDERGNVLPEHRSFIEAVLKGVRATRQYEVFCAVEHEGWAIKDEPPEVGVSKDLAKIESAEVILGLVDGQPSPGVQFELGYSAAKTKRVIIAAEITTKLSYFNQGLVNAGLAAHIRYQNPEDLVRQFVAVAER